MPDEQLENDIVAMVAPQTGAREIDILDPGNPDVTLTVALYQAEKMTAGGVKDAEPSILFRFQPTLEPRSQLLGAHGHPLRGPGPQLWTPEQGLPEG